MPPAPQTFLRLSHGCDFLPLGLPNILFVPLILMCLTLRFVCTCFIPSSPLPSTRSSFPQKHYLWYLFLHPPKNLTQGLIIEGAH